MIVAERELPPVNCSAKQILPEARWETRFCRSKPTIALYPFPLAVEIEDVHAGERDLMCTIARKIKI
jgi:hypothetical protein